MVLVEVLAGLICLMCVCVCLSDLVSKMTVSQLKQWLADNDVDLPSGRPLKSDLVELVVKSAKKQNRASPKKKVSPGSMTIPQVCSSVHATYSIVS